VKDIITEKEKEILEIKRTKVGKRKVIIIREEKSSRK